MSCRIVYEGEWRSNSRNGHGKYTSANGYFFEGDFVNDEMMGYMTKQKKNKRRK